MTVEAEITAAMRAGDWAAVDHLTGRLPDPRPPPPIISATLWYAEQGLKVFPLQPGKKMPYPGSRGCKDATSDLGQIRAWWGRWPESNVGIATGHIIDVIDVDGPVGVKSWAKMIDSLPTILGTVSTPRGSHLYIVATGAGNRAGVADGIDYRGVGGYVVAPVSVNDVGVRYRWRTPLALPATKARCLACGQIMIIIEPGQTTHPGCDAP